MKRLAIAAAAALAMLGGAAHAQQATSPFYGELGYTFMKVDAGSGIDANPGAIRGIVGWDFHPYLALEGMLAGGVSDDDSNVTVLGFPTTVNLRVENTYGIYVKPKYDFNNQFQVFGRLGWAKTKVRTRVTVAGLTSSSSGDDDDFSFGVGLNYRFNPRMYVGLDYMVYYDKGNTKVDGWTIGLGYRF